MARRPATLVYTVARASPQRDADLIKLPDWYYSAMRREAEEDRVGTRASARARRRDHNSQRWLDYTKVPPDRPGPCGPPRQQGEIGGPGMQEHNVEVRIGYDDDGYWRTIVMVDDDEARLGRSAPWGSSYGRSR